MSKAIDRPGGLPAAPRSRGRTAPAVPPPAPAPPSVAAAVAATTAATSPGGGSRSAFADAVLNAAGLPVTQANVNFMLAWMNREGTAASFNPLATTERIPGSVPLPGNSAGVQQYADLATGAQATARTLLNGNYGDVVAALKSGSANPSAHYAGLGTWSGGGYTTLSGIPASDGTLPGGGGGASGAGGTAGGAGTAGSSNLASQVGIQSTLPQYNPNTAVSINSYGYIAALAKDVPDIARLMKKYANEDLSSPAVVARLEADIKNTGWYQKHDAGHRSMQILKATDPSEYGRQLGEMSKQVSLEAQRQGTVLDPATTAQFSKDALAEGWSTQQIDKYLAAQYQSEHGTAPGGTGQAVGAPAGAPQGAGDIGALQRQFTQQAADYLVPVSDSSVLQWAQKAVAGQVTADDYTNYLKGQAKSLFPGMAVSIDAGVTPEQYTDPYKQLASQVLQMPADTVNFADPKWNRALFQVDAKTGARTPMSLTDWATTLRQDPTYGYSKTPGARSQAADMTQQILDEFGATGNYGGNG